MNFNMVMVFGTSLIMFWGACNNYNQQKKTNDILLYGDVVTAVVSTLPDGCSDSYRLKNYSKVILPDGREYKLRLNYRDCESMAVGEKISVFYSIEHNDILRCTAANSDRKPSSFLSSILLALIAIGFFIYFIKMFVAGRKK